MSETTVRVKSKCVYCGQTDDHPKHHPEGLPHHFDCGNENSCETCASMRRASGGLHGEELTRFMKSRLTSGV